MLGCSRVLCPDKLRVGCAQEVAPASPVPPAAPLAEDSALGTALATLEDPAARYEDVESASQEITAAYAAGRPVAMNVLAREAGALNGGGSTAVTPAGTASRLSGVMDCR